MNLLAGKIAGWLPFLLAVLLTGGCADVQEVPVEEAIRVSQEMIGTQQSFTNVYEEISYTASTLEELNTDGQSFLTPVDCVKLRAVSDDTGVFPTIFEFDYGNACQSGIHQFSGKVLAEFDGFVDNENTQIEVDLQDFQIDQSVLQGTYSIAKKGSDDQGRLVIEHQIHNGISIKEQYRFNIGASIVTTLINSDFQANPNGIPEVIENTWEENINATFVDSESVVYTVTTESPVVTISTWPIPVAGVLKLENLSNQLSFSIDFGNYEKDNFVMITIGEETTELSL